MSHIQVLRKIFHEVIEKCQVDAVTPLVCPTDARILELGYSDGQDALLGSGNGRLAPPAGHPSAEVVSVGQRAGRDERD